MPVIFTSNSTSHFTGAEKATDLWSYDPNFVPYAMKVNPQQVVAAPTLSIPRSTTDLYFHFRMGAEASQPGANDTVTIIALRDLGGRTLYSVEYTRSTKTFTFKPLGASETTVTGIPFGSEQVRTFDIAYTYDGTRLHIDCYLNELLLNSFEELKGGLPPVQTILLGGSETLATFYSEVLIQTTDTRNARVKVLTPNATGFHDDWSGEILSLYDDDPTTGMVTSLANREQTVSLTPYTGASNVSTIVQATTSVRGIGSPSKLRHMFRAGGVDYSSQEYNVPLSKTTILTEWTVSPVTNLPWSSAELTGLEFGFQSRT